MKEFRKPHKSGRRFYNREGEDNRRGFSFLHSIRMLFSSYLFHRSNPIKGQSCWIASDQPKDCSIDPVITWIGHASFLIQVGGFNILVDPIFGDLLYVYKRMLPPGIPLEKLPPIDFILISHNHPDHMDPHSLRTIKERNPNVTVLVPSGDKKWFDKQGFIDVHEHSWWEKHSAALTHDGSKKITFSFLPAAHWSQQGFFDKNTSLWGSWMIECLGQKIYFAGDSYYAPHFSEIAQQFPTIDVALLPVGPCEPRGWLEDFHLDGKEAGKAFLDLGAKKFVPMHWGTFAFGVEHFDAPVKMIQQWWKEHEAQLGGKQLCCVKVGEAVAFGSTDAKLKSND